MGPTTVSLSTEIFSKGKDLYDLKGNQSISVCLIESFSPLFPNPSEKIGVG